MIFFTKTFKMKLRLLSLLLVMHVVVSHAQLNVKRSFIGASLFFPTPVGQFKSTDVKEDGSGFAKGSLGFGLEGAYMFHPNIGIGGIWAGYASKFDAKEFKSGIEKNSKQEGLYGSWSVTGDPHSIGVLMVGAYASLPFKKVSLDAKFFVGNFAYKLADVQVTYKENGATLQLAYAGEYVNTLGINPGVAARIKLSNRLALKLGVDYVFGKPEVKSKLTSKVNGQTISSKDDAPYKAEVAIVNIGFGLAFQLNKEE